MLELIKEMFTRYFSRDLQNWRVCFSKFCRDADRIGLFPFKTNVIPQHWVKAIWNSTFVPLRILISPYIFSGRSNWALEIRARKKRQRDVDKARGKSSRKKTPEGGHLKSLTLLFLIRCSLELSATQWFIILISWRRSCISKVTSCLFFLRFNLEVSIWSFTYLAENVPSKSECKFSLLALQDLSL